MCLITDRKAHNQSFLKTKVQPKIKTGYCLLAPVQMVSQIKYYLYSINLQRGCLMTLNILRRLRPHCFLFGGRGGGGVQTERDRKQNKMLGRTIIHKIAVIIQ